MAFSYLLLHDLHLLLHTDHLKRHSFLNFSYVCPEPVVVKSRFYI
jgi:hypothetical protein